MSHEGTAQTAAITDASLAPTSTTTGRNRKGISGMRLGSSSGRNLPRPPAARPSSNGNTKGKARADVDEREPAISGSTGGTEDERFRRVTRPPALLGKSDWGLPPLPDEPCDPVLEVRGLRRSLAFR